MTPLERISSFNAGERRIFVGIPCYNGMLCAETANSLMLEQAAAFARGWEFRVDFSITQSILHLARNKIVADFIASDCTDFLFIDADVAWEAGKLCELIASKADIVGAVYRHKKDDETYPLAWLDDKTLSRDSETGFLEVRGVPTGLMHVKRHVFETIISMRPELEYDDPYCEGRKTHAFFDFSIENRIPRGEDMNFCRLAKECGFKIWLEPQIGSSHVGRKEYRGNCGEYLLNRGDHLRDMK